MAPVESGYYDLLGVPFDVSDADLKKAYRKQAMKYHPDKNPSTEAEEKFKEISKAYQILSDPNLKEVYDRNGAAMTEKEGNVGVDDAAQFFGKVFGGDAFNDYIGEISLMKEMTSMATATMTDEEKAELEKQMNGGGPLAPGITEHERPASPTPANKTTLGIATDSTAAPTASTSVTPDPTKEKAAKKKLSQQQREKLDQLERERREKMKLRIDDLSKKLSDRLRAYVESTSTEEIGTWEKRMQQEAEDLKFESFGVELLHTIGTIYATKGTSFMKSKKLLGLPGFWSRLKEKGAVAKDAWGLIGSAVDVKYVMADLEKAQEKGEVPEEELRVLEMDLTGKILLASWRGTRFEVVQVLRSVCDNVLKDKTVSEQVLLQRAKGMLVLGAIFKQVQPDESAEERRELERMVAEAAMPRDKKKARRTPASPGHTSGIATPEAKPESAGAS